MNRVLLVLAAAFSIIACAPAQDATVVAPRNYKIEFENELVRVVRVTYAPHEKTELHQHQGNATVIVVLQGGGRMHQVNEDGSVTEGNTEKAGAVRFVPARSAFKHASENVSDAPIETIRVELKAPPPCAQHAPAQPVKKASDR